MVALHGAECLNQFVWTKLMLLKPCKMLILKRFSMPAGLRSLEQSTYQGFQSAGVIGCNCFCRITKIFVVDRDTYLRMEKLTVEHFSEHFLVFDILWLMTVISYTLCCTFVTLTHSHLVCHCS